MKKANSFSLLLLASCLTMSARSQDDVAARLRAWSDQKVHITGEDVWVDGDVSGDIRKSRSVIVRLIDRNGATMAEAEFAPNGYGFSGYLTIPENLVSDYYFLDCQVNGLRTAATLSPIMVINPRIAPAANCKDALPETVPAPAPTNMTVIVDHDRVPTRSEVVCRVNYTADLRDLTVTVYRQDQLTAMMDSVSSQYANTIVHEPSGVAEDEGKIVRAKATVGGRPADHLNLIAALKGSGAVLSTATTNADGMATFVLPMTYDASTLVLTPQNAGLQGVSISVVREAAGPATVRFACLRLRESQRGDIEARLLNSKVLNRYYGDNARSYDVTERDTSDFYGKPDVKYNLDEYVRFPNMEEVIGEIIPEVRVKKDKGDRILQVLNLPMKDFFPEEGLVLVDGVPLRDTKKIIDADPLLIRSIEVVSRRYIMGNTEFKGIVHFKSYRGDMAGLQLSPGDASVPYQGNQESATLNTPESINKGDRLPDLRNLLLKEKLSDEQIRNGFHFFSSDATGDYKVQVRGRRENGTVATSSSVVTVTGPASH
jgi:hypothetical protein